MSQESTSKIAQERSPRFPSDSLEFCIGKIESAYSEIGRNAVPAETLAKALGFKSLSGASRPLLASLSYYGLLQRVGHVHRVSELALRIIRPISDADRVSAIKQASLEPKLVAQIAQEHPDCSESVLASLLIRKGFTEDGAKRAAKIFKDNLEFISKLGDVPSQATTKQEPANNPTAVNQTLKPPITPPQMSNVALIDFPVPLPSGAVAYYRLPPSITETDFTFYQKLLTHLKEGLVRQAAVTEKAPAASIPEASINGGASLGAALRQ